MKLVQLDIERLEPSHSHKSSYVLILREVGGERKLPIVIGPCNAGSIAIYLESDKDLERPLTHDVIKSITNSFSITISRVVIHTLLEGVFHASFFCFLDGDEEIEIDARTSDAIAIMLGYSPMDQLSVGYSYDITLNKLSSISRGSHEMFVKYCIYIPPPPLQKTHHPRWL